MVDVPLEFHEVQGPCMKIWRSPQVPTQTSEASPFANGMALASRERSRQMHIHLFHIRRVPAKRLRLQELVWIAELPLRQTLALDPRSLPRKELVSKMKESTSVLSSYQVCLGTESRALCTLSKTSATELQPCLVQLLFFFFWWGNVSRQDFSV